VPVDPTEGIGSPEVKKPLPRTAREEDVRALLAFCGRRDTPEGERDHAMLRLLWATGMRVGELVTLNVSDVDLANARVRVVGRGLEELRQILGHASIATTQIYSQLAGQSGDVPVTSGV